MIEGLRLSWDHIEGKIPKVAEEMRQDNASGSR